jgi:hypothetical protein
MTQSESWVSQLSHNTLSISSCTLQSFFFFFADFLFSSCISLSLNPLCSFLYAELSGAYLLHAFGLLGSPAITRSPSTNCKISLLIADFQTYKSWKTMYIRNTTIEIWINSCAGLLCRQSQDQTNPWKVRISTTCNCKYVTHYYIHHPSWKKPIAQLQILSTLSLEDIAQNFTMSSNL